MGRVWDASGVWNRQMQRRLPQIERIELGIVEEGEKFWLYRVEMAVVMVEVKRIDAQVGTASQAIGQVVLKRLIDAVETLDRLSKAESVFNTTNDVVQVPGESSPRPGREVRP